jgi:hypothetical protein
VGLGVRLQDSAQNVYLQNNIISVDSGYAISVAGNSATGFGSNYNLFDVAPGATVGLWNGANRTLLNDWQTASGTDAASLTGDPLFLDIDGADNVFGEQGVSTGNGADDNFGLRKSSPAIDRANAYVASLIDIENRARKDDPGTANGGIGWDLFVPADTGASSFASVGTAQNWRSTNSAWTLNLPFGFQFYGKTYNSVQVSANGFLHFEGPDFPTSSDDNSLDLLQRNVRIAPLWDNLETSSTGKDIFVDTSVAGQVTIRWQARLQQTLGGDVNFSVTLRSNGTFRFDYGPGNAGLTPTVGVSAGNGYTFVLAPNYDGAAILAGANSLEWMPTPGLTYYDIGAYEFQGDSGDATPPIVTLVTNLPAPSGSTAAAFTSLQIGFSEPLDGISARSPANYSLLEAGLDGLFDTTDDVKIAVKPAYSFPETNLTLNFLAGVLPDGDYRLSLSGSLAIYDTAGNPLDGNADGTGGDDYVRFFTIDRSGNQAPVAGDQALNVSEGTPLVITLSATDADGDPLAYSLVGTPQHGVLSSFDPVTRQVTYTPNANYTGPDSFSFKVDDGKLGVDTGTIALAVLPVNDSPTAQNQSVTLNEDESRLIVLDGSDVETTRANLVFTLVTAPTHGTLAQGPAGGWTYTPAANYTGTDSFAYTVADRGDPDGVMTNAVI